MRRRRLEAGRVGALSATYALESLGTQAHAYSIDDFLARYAEHFGAVPETLRAVLTHKEH